MSNTSAAVTATGGLSEGHAAAVSHNDGAAPAHESADQIQPLENHQTPAQIFPFACYLAAPMVRVSPGSNRWRQDAGHPFFLPVPEAAKNMFGAFSRNIQSSTGTVSNTVSVSFMRGINGKYFFNMADVEVAMGAKDGANFSEAQKEHVRSGPCGAGWIAKIARENAGAASTISPLHNQDVKDHLMEITGYCLNVGDDDGANGGGIYHFSYGIASKAGAKDWTRGCTVQHLRDSLGTETPASSSFVHASSSPRFVHSHPGAPPAQPGQQPPPSAAAAALNKKNVQASAVPAGAGGEAPHPKKVVKPIECRRMGCSELFETESLEQEHFDSLVQDECDGLELMDEVGSEAQEDGKGPKRPLDPSWGAEEENKKPRPEDSVYVRVFDDIIGETTVVFKPEMYREYVALKGSPAEFREKLQLLSETRAQFYVSALLGETKLVDKLLVESSTLEKNAKQSAMGLASVQSELKQAVCAAGMRETMLQKQAMDMCDKVAKIQGELEHSTSRADSRIASLRASLEQEQESIKAVLVGMVRQLGLEGRVAGDAPPAPVHHAPSPAPPPADKPPMDPVNKENIGAWIKFWRRTSSHLVTDLIMTRFLKDASFMVDKVAQNAKKCYYCGEATRMQTKPGGRGEENMHVDAHGSCMARKCPAKEMQCGLCKRAGLKYSNHVLKACPFTFDACKAIASKNYFEEELDRKLARDVARKKEQQAREQQAKLNKEARQEIEGRLKEAKDAQLLAAKDLENLKAKSSVSRGPSGSGFSSASAVKLSVPKPVAKPPDTEWEYTRSDPGALKPKAVLLRFGKEATNEDWAEYFESQQ